VTNVAGAPESPQRPACCSAKPEKMATLPKTLIGFWIMALFAVTLAQLPWAWSLAAQVTAVKHAVHAHWLGLAFVPQKTAALLIVVILTALIGSAAALALTFAWRVGYNKLEKGWAWWYITRPPTAASIGVLAFALLEAGFFSSGSTAKSNLLAAAATGGLAGLFTDQLLQKMRSVLGLSPFDQSASGTDDAGRAAAPGSRVH
jgi:hypothetical protein